MRIFIAHSNKDAATASAITDQLREQHHEVIGGIESFKSNTSWAQHVNEIIQQADALIILWSEAALGSGHVLVEANYFLGAFPDRPLLPVLLDDSQIPLQLAGFHFLKAQYVSIDDLAWQVVTNLSRQERERTKEKQAAEERKEIVERSADAYISQSLDALGKRERKFQHWSFACYSLGYVTIVAGLILTLYRVTRGTPSLADIPTAIYTGLLTISAIGFLAAAARFAFVLGRSFMVESLRNNDRTHAIKFGEFYLKAFGDKLSWPELKEAFQYWNVDSGSTFKDQKEEAIDPQVLKSLVELAQTLKK